jgi:hypothetical protein
MNSINKHDIKATVCGRRSLDMQPFTQHRKLARMWNIYMDHSAILWATGFHYVASEFNLISETTFTSVREHVNALGYEWL